MPNCKDCGTPFPSTITIQKKSITRNIRKKGENMQGDTIDTKQSAKD
jgi:hypothetical protein